MHLRIIAIAILGILTFSISDSRYRAPFVKPLVYKGVIYKAPNDNKAIGYVEAYDQKTGRELWSRFVFDVNYWPYDNTRGDRVYIKDLRIQNEQLIVITNLQARYHMQLRSPKSP